MAFRLRPYAIRADRNAARKGGKDVFCVSPRLWRRGQV